MCDDEDDKVLVPAVDTRHAIYRVQHNWNGSNVSQATTAAERSAHIRGVNQQGDAITDRIGVLAGSQYFIDLSWVGHANGTRVQFGVTTD